MNSLFDVVKKKPKGMNNFEKELRDVVKEHKLGKIVIASPVGGVLMVCVKKRRKPGKKITMDKYLTRVKNAMREMKTARLKECLPFRGGAENEVWLKNEIKYFNLDFVLKGGK